MTVAPTNESGLFECMRACGLFADDAVGYGLALGLRARLGLRKAPVVADGLLVLLAYRPEGCQNPGSAWNPVLALFTEGRRAARSEAAKRAAFQFRSRY